ncbi:hypothetical protein AKJ16_DCAP14447 [Drosera capensis]
MEMLGRRGDVAEIAPLNKATNGERTAKLKFIQTSRFPWPCVGRCQFLAAVAQAGWRWANDALHVPKIAKTVDDFVWLRVLEDANAQSFQRRPSWHQPHYPALSGLDLFVADLRAMETYANFFYCMSKMWSHPLPEFYNPDEIVGYFNCRPQVVALRLIEVFSAFFFTVIKIRMSRDQSILRFRRVDGDINGTRYQYDFGVVLKETMLNLGPTFIKVGQSLSTRPDIIGFEIAKALGELHEQIPPFPRTLAMKIIEEELGTPVERSFFYVSEEPVAAASFGQVYRGTTYDGCDVAIKVQRPNLRHVVARDIYILRLGLELLQKIAKRKGDLRLYADELGKGLMGELDYTLEAANASDFLVAHSPFPFICVPKVIRHLTGKRVLTMEWLVGENPRDLILVSDPDQYREYSQKQKLDAKQRLLDLVTKGVEATLVQLLETGLLHADPHPGNMRYTTSGQIGFLDFGLVCRMERKHQLAMLASIVHIVNGDWASLVNALFDMDIVRPGTEIRRVTMELKSAFKEVEFKDGIPDIKFSRVLGKIWSVALKYHFRMPPYYTLVLRSLASLEGLAVAADENFRTFEAAYPYVVRKLLIDNSESSRRILHSVVLNGNKEFQWQKLALFLKVGSMRTSFQKGISSSSGASINSADPAFDVANFALRLLPSQDGIVLRRLLITANGASLIRALLSREADFVRKKLCHFIADILSQWVTAALGGNASIISCDAGLYGRGPAGYDAQSILRDRRLKLIFRKVLADTSKDPLLMLRLCMASLKMTVTASAMSCHHILVSLSESLLQNCCFFSSIELK